MHVSRFAAYSATTPSDTTASSFRLQARSLRRFRRRPWTLSLFAMFVVLVLSGSRAAYAATYTVTDNSDNAADTGSLRYAVNTAVSGDAIGFAPGVTGTIVLTNGPLTVNASVTISGPGAGLLTISGNKASAILTINSGTTVNISGLTLANGVGSEGGGIYNVGALTVNYCIFTGNHGVYGGAIMNYFGSTLWVNSSLFSSNTAVSNGGGGIGNYGTLTVSASTFSGNGGGYGGGIENESNATVADSTFSGNTGSYGGGIFNNVGATLTVTNSTFSGNAGPNGGISNYSGGTSTVTNSIVAEGCTNCTLTGSNLIGGTPDLSPLQYNGSLIQTMLPRPGSPAIGAGSGSTLATDERGFARPTGSGVASDLGAVQTSYLTVTNLNDSGAGSLRQAVLDANSSGSEDIVFQSGLTGTIALASILPSISGNVNLAGPGANQLTISGQGNSSVIDIPNASALVNLSGVTISYGNDPINLTAAVSSHGILTVENSAFSYNQGANGGAIFNNGTLGVENATFSNNIATDGGGIDSQSTLIVMNSTFFGNRAYNGNGGGIENSGPGSVTDSTITGNESLNGGVGAGLDNSGGSLTVSNSIVTANMNLSTHTENDCNNCTQNGPLLTGSNPELGPLAYNGLNATAQTMLPLPGSPAIQTGDPTQLTPGLSTDERGFARLTGGKLDLGAVQTNYTAVQFVQQPTDTFFNANISPAVTAEVLETNTNLAGPNNTDAVSGIPITLTLNGGTLGGTLTQTTAGGVASFGDLMISAPGTGDTLTTSLTVTPAGITPVQTLTATSSPFNISLLTQTITFVPTPPASVIYGAAPIALAATSSAGLSVTFQVDSGPAAIIGNMMTFTGAGTVVVEADAAANATYAAALATQTITVTKAASHLALTASATQAPIGSSVTLTATATSATTGMASGTVTFADGGTQLGQAALNAQGVATLAVTTLSAGSNTITADYAGDTNFLGSQAQLAGTVMVGAPGFTMTSSTSNLAIQQGMVGSMTLTLTPTFGYAGPVSLACSGMPVKSICVFQPSTVTFDGSGSPVQVTLTMEIGPVGLHSRGTSVAEVRPWSPLGNLPMLPAMIFWLPGTGSLSDLRRTGTQSKQSKTRTKSRRWLRMGALLLFCAGLLGVTGCAGKGIDFNSPPSGQYPVTITATGSGNVSQSIAVQLNVL